MGFESGLSRGKNEAHDKIAELGRVAVGEHDLGFIEEEVFFDFEFFEVIAFHGGLEGHSFIHGEGETEDLVLVDQGDVIELFVPESCELLR
jgi:hypothetical protein